MSCFDHDDDMFPRHAPMSFDPATFMKSIEYSLNSPTDSASTPSSLSSSSFSKPSPLKAALSSTCSTTSCPTSSFSSCDHAELLSEHQHTIAMLQQDVFALRQLLDSEMNKMRQEVKQSLSALEARLLQACKQQTAGDETTASSPPSALVKAQVKSEELKSPTSASPTSRGHRVWADDFLDSECGDDFVPSHPSQMEEKDQQAMLEKVMKEKEKEHTVKPKEEEAPKDSKPSAPPPSSASSTALSISSLTALINPAGLPLTEPQLITLACRILSDHGSVPVGKMGSLLHKAANDHTLPALLKERYGGLKKFLQAQSKYFILGEDHPYNPHVALVGQQQLPSIAQPAPATPAPPPPVKEVNAGSVHDAYARSLVDSSLMEDRDSFFPSHLPASRKAITPTHPSSHRPVFSPSSTSSLPSYSSRLQEAMASCSQPDLRSLSAHMDSLLTEVISLDCEMVGCGPDGSRSILARCSIVNYQGAVLYDCFVQPSELIIDYRTHVSGIRPGDLEPPKAIPFHQCQREVKDLLHGRTVVAHSVVGDLQALGITHPISLLRDTAHFPLLCPDRPRSLRSLVHERLGWLDFQQGEHDSVDDARAVMSLYRLVEEAWEAVVKEEQALEEREQKQMAARSAANARQRALLIEQQQRENFNNPTYGHAPKYVGHELEQRVGGGGLHFGNAGSGLGHSLSLNLLPSSHSSIHSTLWGK